MKRLDLIIGVALLAVAVGCSSNTLTRAKAKALLETKAPATVDIYSTADELTAGVQKGLWVRTGSYKSTALLNNCMVFTDPYRGTLSSGPYSGSQGSKFGIKVVEITGISDASTLLGPAGKVKIVEFTYLWDFAGCSDVVRTVFATPMKHRSLLQLYDDGWRLEAWSGELLD
jgi:hypothetical protein